jgi:hypothetical protein
MSAYLRLGDFNVPGYGLQVNGNLDIRTEDLSGETSGSDQVEKGVKPKRLTVSLNIRFRHQADLNALVRVAEKRGANGDLAIHTIVNRTANAAGIRQVQFTDTLSWTELDGLLAWTVSFTLREYLSVPERVEQRQAAANTVQQTSAATPVAENAATGVQLTNFEKLLAKVDAFLK